MNKQAAAEFSIHELIKNRWSPRAFSDKAVAPGVLRSLFEAARWAPSSYNAQPWSFLVGTTDNPENHAKVVQTLVEFNANWAKKAAVLGIALAALNFAHNGSPNRNAFYDTGAAMAFLTFEATARGLAVHQMAGFDPETARDIFSIPAGWEPIAAFAIGYPGAPESLPESFREQETAPRVRKPIREFVMSGKWGHTAEFVAK
jgi:nitroreductase